MRTRIWNITLTPGADGAQHLTFIRNAEVQINNNRIVYAGSTAEAPWFEADESINGEGCLCMPGLVNMHTHTPMTLLRGVGDCLNLQDWLHQAVFPLEKQWDDELIRTATELGMLEMLQYGTTTFCDMYMHTNVMAEAVRDAGMRALLGHGIVDFDESCADMVEGVEMAKKWHKSCNDRIRFSLAPHSEYCTTPVLMERVARVAKEMGLCIHIHVSETKSETDGCMERRGMTPAAYLEKMGLTDSPVIAAHCVWTTDEDIELFKRCNVTVVHNPVSNLKLASGIAPIAKMLDRGCNVTLGTDGVASNNNLNLWEEMKLMPMLQRGVSYDPTIVSPAQVIAAATINGARAIGYDDLGLLKEGYLADLILVNLNTPQMTPVNGNLETDVVYAMQGGDVRLTMVDGKVLYRDGAFATLDKADVLKRSQLGAEEMRRKLENVQ